jgi:hypothetical protein
MLSSWVRRLRSKENPDTLERRRIFESIHRSNAWGDPESVSGTGSNIARTSLFRPDLEALVRDLGVRTLLDAPCGDFNWICDFNLPIDRYIGVDIVPELVLANRAKALSSRQRFMTADIVCDPLPRADLILCRDALIHLRIDEIFATLRNFQQSRSVWLLTNTWIDHPDNIDIVTGDWRTLNLEAPPFGFPPPIRMIDEQCFVDGGAYRDKRLALWDLATLPV